MRPSKVRPRGESTAPDGRRIRTVIVDDSAFIVENLRSFFGQQQEFEVVGVAETGVQAVERVAEVKPDLVVMDVRMPRMDGLDATQRIKAGKGAPVVIIFSLEDSEAARGAAKAAGADGFVAKARGASDALAAAIRRAFPGAKLGGRK